MVIKIKDFFFSGQIKVNLYEVCECKDWEMLVGKLKTDGCMLRLL